MENFTSSNGQFYWWFGVVEDRNDPLRMGRCRVRILGYHVDDLELLPTEDLPWAMPVMPANSASSSGVGWSPTGAVEGSWVVGFFADGPSMQHPMFWGTVGAVPGGLTGTGCSDGEAGSGEPGSPESSGDAPTNEGSAVPSSPSPEKDFWTLVAVCSQEQGDPQGQCDVAQTIYNRVIAGVYGGRTIASVILARGQYEPVFTARRNTNPHPLWRAIKDVESAAAATRSDGRSAKSVSDLIAVARNLKNPQLQAAARAFIQSRTDFRGNPYKDAVVSRVDRSPGSNRTNAFGFNKNGNYRGRAGIAPIPDVVKNININV